MNRCIYCRSEINHNEPPDDMTCSKEHIVQFALGGSNSFTTMDASTKYNSDLGRDIDSKFINLMPLAIKRHTLKLKGQSGTIPSIVWQARSLDNGEPSSITIHPDGNIDYAFDPLVVKDIKNAHEERLVAGSPDRVQEILTGMLAKATKQGKTIYSETGERISRLEDFEPHFEIEETDLFRASVQAFDFEVWVRGIFKIVLGLGHVILGPDWTFSADGGDRVRSVLFCDREHWPAQSMKGFVVGELPPTIRKVMGIMSSVSAANHHTLAILPQEKETVAIISLFGGNGVPEALVTLGSERGNLATVNDTMNPLTRVGVRIDPTTRRTTWITVADINHAAEP